MRKATAKGPVRFGDYSGFNFRKAVRSIPIGLKWVEYRLNNTVKTVYKMEREFLYQETRQLLDGEWVCVGTCRWYRNGTITN